VINIKNINVNDTSILSEIKMKFPGVVKSLVSEEECIKDHETNLEIRENNVPKFQRPYQVTYVIYLHKTQEF